MRLLKKMNGTQAFIILVVSHFACNFFMFSYALEADNQFRLFNFLLLIYFFAVYGLSFCVFYMKNKKMFLFIIGSWWALFLLNYIIGNTGVENKLISCLFIVLSPTVLFSHPIFYGLQSIVSQAFILSAARGFAAAVVLIALLLIWKLKMNEQVKDTGCTVPNGKNIDKG